MMTLITAGQSLNLCDVALTKLNAQEQEALRSGLTLPVDFEDLRTAIAATRDHEASSRWKTKTRQYFNNALSWIQKFILVGDTIVTYDPGHAALPWAAFRFILQMMVNDASRSAEFAKGLERVAFYVYDAASREAIYLSAVAYTDSNELQNTVVELYTTILKFLLTAKVFYEAKAGRRMLSSLLRTDDEVAQFLSPAAEQASRIVIISGRIDAEIGVSTNSAVQNLVDANTKSLDWLKQQLRENNSTVADFQDTMISQHGETIYRLDSLADQLSQVEFNRGAKRGNGLNTTSILHLQCSLNVIRAVDAFQSTHKRFDRVKILQWLSSTPYSRHHKATYEGILEGTGSWFLNDDAFMKWQDSDQGSSMLWLHGPPGSGKTNLTSLAIQRALDSSEDSYFPLYFYCSRTPAEPERAIAESILQCLVKQLSTGRQDDQNARIPRYVVEKYSRAELGGFASGHLMVAESRDIINNFAIDKKKVMIMIDALDECLEDSKHIILRILKEVMGATSASTIKVLISSRDDLQLPTFFERLKTYDINVESRRNQQDIDLYVKTQLDTLITQKRIMVAGGKPPSQKLREFIVKTICDGAQGMFRWASLQLDYLCTLRSVSDIKHRLGRLPKSLEASYADLFDQNVKNYEEEDRRRLGLILSLLLVPSKPVAPIFAAFVFWEGEEEDDFEDEASSIENDELHDGESSDPDPRATNEDDKKSISERYAYVTKLCFNLVIFDCDNDTFRFAHSSVQDFVERCGEKHLGFHINTALLAEQGISIILQTFSLPSRSAPNAVEAISSRVQAYGQMLDEPTRDKDPGLCAKARKAPLREEAILYAEMNWSNFLASSEEEQKSSSLKEMYTELLLEFLKHSKESVRLWIFFSACHFGLKDFVEACVKASPALTHACVRYPISTTALMVACDSKQSQKDIVEVLIANGADPFFSNSWDPTPWRPVHMALSKKHADVAKRLIEQEPDFANTRRSDSMRTLFLTLILGLDKTIPVLRSLLEKHTPLNLTLDEVLLRPLTSGFRRLTPLHCAVFENSPEAIQLLIDNGADMTVETAAGYTLLHLAATSDKPDMIEVLLDRGLDIDARTPSGATPLILSCYAQRVENCRILLSRRASLEPDGLGWSPLIIAALLNNEELVALLIASNIDINFKSKEGLTALHLAASEHFEKILKALLGAGAEIDEVDFEGETALSKAVVRGHRKIAETLLANGANVERMTTHGTDCLAIAAQTGQLGLTELLLPWSPNLNLQDADGDTPLSCAAYEGHVAVVQLLLDTGCEIVPTDPGPHCSFLAEDTRRPGYGRDALLRAWAAGHRETAGIILETAVRRNIPGSYAEGLKLFNADDLQPFTEWIAARAAQAAEQRSEIVAFREEVARMEKMVEEEAARNYKVKVGFPLGEDPELVTALISCRK